MKYYVISDTHGFYTYTMQALNEKGFFEDTTEHKLIICGDIFDRGNETKKLQKFIMDLIKEDKVILIKGNHEDLVREFVKNIYHYIENGLTGSHHFQNGTIETCELLTGMDKYDIEINPAQFIKKINNTPFFKAIIPRMVNYFETKNYIFVHGWIPCKANGYGGNVEIFEYDKNWRNASMDDWNFARWYNGIRAAKNNVIEKGKTIVCGHWHCSFGHSKFEGLGSEFGTDAVFTPYYDKGIIALDACTVYSHKVNCIVIDE